MPHTVLTTENVSDLSVDRALSAIRRHLSMDVAYVSEFVGDQSVFRVVDAPGLEDLIKPGDSRPLDEVYCRHIVEGRLPELMPDTSQEPLAASMPITAAVPIGSHMSIPLRFPDGELYGMFCCLSAKPNPSLNERDLATMRLFANLAAERLADETAQRRKWETIRDRITSMIEADNLAIVFQPIVDMKDGHVIGFECLSRFTATPVRPPNEWFDEAGEVGMRSELELTAIRLAMDYLALLPNDLRLSVNVSPATAVTDAFLDFFSSRTDRELASLTLEITEHAAVDDYISLASALQPLRERGLAIAVDDAGAGYASLRHIVSLHPDVIKIDLSLVRDIDTDHAKRSLAQAIVFFARELDISVVAEGVETESERMILQALGVPKGQGYLFGRPEPFERIFTGAPDATKTGTG